MKIALFLHLIVYFAVVCFSPSIWSIAFLKSFFLNGLEADVRDTHIECTVLLIGASGGGVLVRKLHFDCKSPFHFIDISRFFCAAHSHCTAHTSICIAFG